MSSALVRKAFLLKVDNVKIQILSENYEYICRHILAALSVPDQLINFKCPVNNLIRTSTHCSAVVPEGRNPAKY